ncbi:hypothetical protein KP509_04G034200 [Ceratopteris richardii]|nr:hypothetical protein KP509_04G034200 [Ceratopteris richardii]
MYAKCKAIDDAENIFYGVDCLSIVSWNLMIKSYLRKGWGEKAFQLFERLQQQSFTPTKVTLICLLSACSVDRKLFTGKTIHTRMLMFEFEDSTAIYTSLLNMYGRCGNIEDVHKAFSVIEDRDVITWNAMIDAFHEHGIYEVSFTLFSRMHVEGIFPNRVTFISMLDACQRVEALNEGRLLHRYATDSGHMSEVSVVTAVISMYGKGNKLEEATFLFKHFTERDTVLWNVMIALYSLHGRSREALNVLDQMLLEGFLPTRITYVSVFNACAIRAATFAGQCVHACIVDTEMENDIDIVNSMINMYGKFGNIENALSAFQNLSNIDVVTWSTMIAAYAEVGQCGNALQAFEEMQQRGITPNAVTIINILHAFQSEEDIDELKGIHDYMLGHGLNEDVMISTALINAYGKCGNIVAAQTVFHTIVKRDMCCWTAIISSHVRVGQYKEALMLFDQMKKSGIIPDTIAIANILAAFSDIDDSSSDCERMHNFMMLQGIDLDDVLGSAMLTMYGRSGKLVLSEALFEILPKNEVTTWNAMMSVYIQHGLFKKALDLFYQMSIKDLQPDKDSFVSSLTACANETSLADGEKVHHLLSNAGIFLNDVIGASLVNMYGKCGCPGIAKTVLDQMPRYSLILWNAVIGFHAQYGEGMKAIQAIQDMCNQGCRPDIISLVSVLNACSHTGLIDEALLFVSSMEDTFSLSPLADHYICVMDMLGRSGRPGEVEVLIIQMPFQPKSVLYMSLLGACQSLANVDLGKRAAKCMAELSSEDSGPYVSLSNIFALQIPEKSIRQSSLSILL